ncbi:hypothetical protein M513_09020 [Trichuris suis]|uniref:Uncharacterized protein n=1 Tax=Trichuris suis TaxID=68888 RepID=A0A085LYL4_9BILA|nr:hypothetical protein M513_09020 [Trichuris suis]
MERALAASAVAEHAVRCPGSLQARVLCKESQLSRLVFSYKGISLCFGLFLAYESRKIKSKYVNDSRPVCMAIYNVAVPEHAEEQLISNVRCAAKEQVNALGMENERLRGIVINEERKRDDLRHYLEQRLSSDEDFVQLFDPKVLRKFIEMGSARNWFSISKLLLLSMNIRGSEISICSRGTNSTLCRSMGYEITNSIIHIVHEREGDTML